MRKTVIVGAGMIRFGRFPDRYIEDMGAEADAAGQDAVGIAVEAYSRTAS